MAAITGSEPRKSFDWIVAGDAASDMSGNITSDIIDLTGARYSGGATIHFSWSGLTGSLDGTIEGFVYNNKNFNGRSTGTAEVVDTDDDAGFINLNAPYQYFSFVYTANNITDGVLLVSIEPNNMRIV